MIARQRQTERTEDPSTAGRRGHCWGRVACSPAIRAAVLACAAGVTFALLLRLYHVKFRDNVVARFRSDQIQKVDRLARNMGSEFSACVSGLQALGDWPEDIKGESDAYPAVLTYFESHKAILARVFVVDSRGTVILQHPSSGGPLVSFSAPPRKQGGTQGSPADSDKLQYVIGKDGRTILAFAAIQSTDRAGMYVGCEILLDGLFVQSIAGMSPGSRGPAWLAGPKLQIVTALDPTSAIGPPSRQAGDDSPGASRDPSMRRIVESVHHECVRLGLRGTSEFETDSGCLFVTYSPVIFGKDRYAIAIAGAASGVIMPLQAHERITYALLVAMALLYVAAMYIVCRGDSDRIRFEEQRRTHAEVANLAKSDFLARMSHEIRTPMNGVLGMMELVLEGELTDKQRKCMELSKQSAGSLLTVINDILDVSKIEAGKLVLANIAFSLRDCLQNTVDVFKHQADDKGVDLMLRIHPDVPDSLTGDPGRLRQILTNLVGNAMKFTERGWIAVDVAVVAKNGRQVELALAVTDTGAGIPEDKQALVFEAFEQADGPEVRKHTGTGLGLAISTQLVEAMGGKITLESTVGDGSTFRFTVLFGMGDPRVVTRSDDDVSGGSLAGCRVLVVTASDANAAVIRQVLGGAGAHCTRIAWGEIAIAELDTAAREGKAFQVVLLDWDIQDMDGFEVARKIREAPSLPQTSVVMLTSVGLRGDANRCVDAGISAYLAKPFDRAELLEVVTAAIASSSGGDTDKLITRHTLREHQACLRILVAEDNYVNSEHVTMLLKNWGHTVVCVENGRQALARHAEESFDLILMDMEMPEMDGPTAAAAIRTAENATGLHVPIIAMTANVLDAARQQCRAAGMDGYVSKPMSGDALLQAIRDVIPAGGEPPLRGVDPEVDQGSPGPSPTPAWDADEALGHVEGNGDALRRLVRTFLADSPKVMALIRLALEKRDGENLRKLGHKFKGSLGLMGAGPARMLAEDIETAGRNADWPHAVEVVAMLDEELTALQELLNEFIKEKQRCEF